LPRAEKPTAPPKSLKEDNRRKLRMAERALLLSSPTLGSELSPAHLGNFAAKRPAAASFLSALNSGTQCQTAGTSKICRGIYW